MHRRIAAVIDADTDLVASAIGDLSTYPEWVELVQRVEPASPSAGDPGPAWLVTLRAKLGPLARSKRLRMVEVPGPDGRARFERREVDGKRHARWVMDAAVSPSDRGADVQIELRYEGRLWDVALERILGDSAERAGPRLAAYLQR